VLNYERELLLAAATPTGDLTVGARVETRITLTFEKSTSYRFSIAPVDGLVVLDLGGVATARFFYLEADDDLDVFLNSVLIPLRVTQPNRSGFLWFENASIQTLAIQAGSLPVGVFTSFAGTEGTIGGVAPPSDGGPLTTTFYLVTSDSLLDIEGTTHEVVTTDVSDDASFRVMFISTIPVPTAQSMHSGWHDFFWSSEIIGTGTGKTKWMLSRAAETIGQPPSGSAIDVTTEQPAKVGKKSHPVAGRLRSSGVAAGPFKLLLVGKPDSAGDIVRATVFDESKVKLTLL
jgi:hypothetical protein